jgi:hypothetical protein
MAADVYGDSRRIVEQSFEDVDVVGVNSVVDVKLGKSALVNKASGTVASHRVMLLNLERSHRS